MHIVISKQALKKEEFIRWDQEIDTSKVSELTNFELGKLIANIIK